ncbi:hypothetical protein IAT38_004478 [Cryptococcus sp. DSM 104549]
MAPTAPSGPSHDSPAAQLLQTHDLVASLPTPYLRLLILFARPIALFRRVLEILFWTSGRRVESWMVIGVWWGLCLGSGAAFRYLLPPLIFLPLVPLSSLRLRRSKPPPSNTPSDPFTSETLLLTLSDLNAIYALLPPSPLPTTSSVYARFRQLGPVRLVRGFVVLWLTWIVLGQFVVGYRTLLGLLGTVLLLLPSPPLRHFVALLSKSLFLRRALALAFLFTFGSPPETSYRFTLRFSLWGWLRSKWTASRRPSLAFALRPKMPSKAAPGSALDDSDGAPATSSSDNNPKVEDPIYFRFEIHENQRWWMGLDWTSALLPQERPSWCDSHLLPVSPPPAFGLPQPMSIIIPTATMTDRYARISRTATWKWFDDDWSIVRAGAGAGAGGEKASGQVPQPAHLADNSDAESFSGFTLNQTQPPPTAQSSGTSTARPSSFISTFGSSPPRHQSLSQHPDERETTLSPGTRAQSIAEQAFAKGLERLKARTTGSSAQPATGGGSPRRSSEISRGRTGSYASEEHDEHAPGAGAVGSAPGAGAGAGAGGSAGVGGAVSGSSLPETIAEKDAATDADGWVYGDNKWENMGPRGGLGKFTRRRRWQRRAICIETVRILKPTDDPPIEFDPTPEDPGAVRNPFGGKLINGNFVPSTGSGNAHTVGSGAPVLAAAAPPSPSPLKSRPAVALSPTRAQTVVDKKNDGEVGSGKAVNAGKEAEERESKAVGVSGSAQPTRDEALRQRLKKAMGSVGA